MRNLDATISPDDLKHEFKSFGGLRDVYIPLDYYSKEPRGYAFVEFYDRRDAEDALRGMDGRKLREKEVSVIMARQRRKSPHEMRRHQG